MRKLFAIGTMGAIALLGVAAVGAMTEAASGDSYAEEEVKRQCKPTQNDYGDDVVRPVVKALASETRVTENIFWRRYIKMACFIKKKEMEYELHYKPAQFSLWL
jgi:hypothetical protein